ncbi:MAG: hypothetical protein ACRCWY_06070 [Cellulosilyticaceae bacterium]
MSYKRMYPPWYELATLLYYTLGSDPCVQIMEPKCVEENQYEMGICVAYQQQADYIRVIVPTEYRTGNTIVCTKVFCDGKEIYFPCLPQKNQRDVANLFCNALRTNPLFQGVLLVPQSFVPIKSYIEVCVVRECIPACGGCYEMSVADAFAQVLKLCYGSLTSTEVIFKHCNCRELREGCLYCRGNWEWE